MAVLQMHRICICAMKENRKKILELLQRKGCLEVEEIPSDEEVFERMNTATQISIFERNAVAADNALEIMNKYAPEAKSMFSSLEGKKDVSYDEYVETEKKSQEIMSLVNEIIKNEKEISDSMTEIDKCKEEIQILQPWLPLDIPMNYAGTVQTGFMVGSITGSYTDETLHKEVEKTEGFPEEADLKVVSSDKYRTYIACVFMKEKRDELERALRQFGFAAPPVMIHHTPAESAKRRENRISHCESEIERIKEEIKKKSELRYEIKKGADYFRTRAEKYKVLGGLLQSRHTFFISGYIPQKEVENLKSQIENNYTAILLDEEIEDEEYPVLLSNGKFTGAVEGVVTSFGYPKKSEIDPTTVTAFFYYFLFGIMLSDAAYGLIMLLACFIAIKKFPNMEKTMQKSLRMFMYCGISTLIWGILFGGFFGNAVSVIGETFFGVDIELPALWFAPIDEPMKMLIYSMLFGIVHLFTGLGIQGYMLLKRKDVISFVSDVLCWYIFLIGLILMFIPTSIFASLAGSQIVFPEWVNTIAKIMAVVGMLGILFMGGRRAKNPVKRLLLGIYSLYDITSWLSDLLSYSRLLALGLATGVIAQVINTMAAMMGKSVIGVIMFILIFILGHALNMAINLLGAYVHTNRLQYVEFFGKFYEGGNREFKPFKENTKYIKVKEN